jgi:Ca-activated chloride channel family protein
MFNLQLDWDLPAKISSQDTRHVLRVRLTPEANSPQLPLQMAIALDTSTSMTGNKLEGAKAACRTVIGQLRDGDSSEETLRDRLSLASFATVVSPLGDRSNTNNSLEAAINSLQADGVTRTDLALNWLQEQLPPTPGIARVAVLITDGHPTNRQGRILDDTTPLVELVRDFAHAGITLFTVGLGDAANFNTDFLVQLGDRGRGGFLYADDPSQLEPQLQEQFRRCQAIGFEDVQLILTPLNQASVESFCRYRPDYLPLEETAPNELVLPPISTRESTDILIEVRVPPVTVHNPISEQDVLKLQVQSSGMNPITAKVAIGHTQSYKAAQQVNREVERDRLGWDINLNSSELPRSLDPNRTGELLTNIQVAAYKSGRTDIMQQAAQQLQTLQQSGQLTPGQVTGLLRDTRKTGNPNSSPIRL